jgi:hypothetical protein
MQSNSRIKRYLIKNIRGGNVFLAEEYTNAEEMFFSQKNIPIIPLKTFVAKSTNRYQTLRCVQKRSFILSKTFSMQVMAQPSQQIGSIDQKWSQSIA